MTARTLPACLTSLLKADRSAIIDGASQIIAQEMEALHGGRWIVDIAHDEGFVLIRKRVGKGAGE